MGAEQNADIADTLQLRDVAMATTFGFLLWGAHWRLLTNVAEPSVCSSDVALCQIILTTCYYEAVSQYYTRRCGLLLPTE